MYPTKPPLVDKSGTIEMTDSQYNGNQTAQAEIRTVSTALKEMFLSKETLAQIEKSSTPDVFQTEEPQILFLGTASMKPTPYRGASAIYYFTKQGCLLMDSAEGSYGQLWDHFGTKQRVDEVLLKTRVVFITHIHGDHQLGILKMM